MEKMNVAGINIAFERRGKGPALVLIHGYPLDHSTWDEVLPLLENDFDLIVPDLRGFGESDVMEADDSIIEYASDIAGLLGRLKIHAAFLAGHSMGGYIALAFAREYPERVSGLALVSTQVQADSPEKKQGRYTSADEVLEKGVGGVAEAMPIKLSSKEQIQKYLHALIGRQRPLGVYSALRAMAERPDSTDLLPTFNFPVLVIHGDADALIPVERGREIKAAHPAAVFTELAGIGHMPMLEDAHAVAEALKTLKTIKI